MDRLTVSHAGRASTKLVSQFKPVPTVRDGRVVRGVFVEIQRLEGVKKLYAQPSVPRGMDRDGWVRPRKARIPYHTAHTILYSPFPVLRLGLANIQVHE